MASAAGCWPGRPPPLTVRQHCGGRLAVEFIYGYVRGRKRCVRSIDEPCYVILTRPDRLPRDYRSQPNDATKDLSRLRSLTQREASLIRTFPESWDWDGVRLRDAWRMTDNAVPPQLAEHLSRALLAASS